MLVKNSEEKRNFVNKLIEIIKGINTKNICNINILDHIIQEIAIAIERTWYEHSKFVNITKHLKEW